jgi:DNA-nicking Smr family endonuclease
MRKRTEKKETDEEARIFRDSMQGVKPLKEIAVPAGLVKPKPKMRRTKPRETEAALSASDAAPLSDTATLPDEHLSFRRPGIQDQVMKRLRRGLIPVQAEIDLHGVTQQAAWEMLCDFLAGCRDRQQRCIRVIHGKGYRSGARGPVLKTAVNTWLRRNHDVVAFTSARAIDGGAGALYVLLRA